MEGVCRAVIHRAVDLEEKLHDLAADATCQLLLGGQVDRVQPGLREDPQAQCRRGSMT